MHSHVTSWSRRSSIQSESHQYAPPITIAVMGATGTGKTSFINEASKSHLPVGTGLESCTSVVGISDEFTLYGRRVILFDMPGFDDTNKSDTDILELISTFLATAYEAGSRLAGVIYIHRISDRRFTEISRRNFEMFRKLCGDSALRNAILVTNMWEDVPEGVGEAREQELITNFFKPALDEGAQYACYHNTAESAHDIIRHIMKNTLIPLQIERELVDERMDIANTAAGKELTGQFRSRLAGLQGIWEELETKTRELTEQVDDMRKVLEDMESKHQEEKRRMEEEMRQMQERLDRQEREQREMKQAEAEYKKPIEELEERLQESINASAKAKAMEEAMRQMQERLDRQERKQREMKQAEAGYKKRIEELEIRFKESGPPASQRQSSFCCGMLGSALSRMFCFGRTCGKCQKPRRTRAVE